MATSLAVPLAYITVLVTGLAIFSRVYRRRKAVEKTTWEAWFPTHPARDTYISLLSSSSANPVPDSLLKSALLVRATADVKRIWRLRDDKAALGSLHTRGLVGDDTMSRFAAAEKELEAEIMDVVQEANTFRQGWGQMIFQTATEMAHAERTRDIVLNIPVIAAREEKRLKIRRKWLVGDHSSGATPGTTNPAGQAPAQGPAAITALPQPASNGTKTPPVEVDSVAETPQKAASTVAEAVSTPVQIGDSGSGSNTPNSKNATPSKSSAKKKKGKK